MNLLPAEAPRRRPASRPAGPGGRLAILGGALFVGLSLALVGLDADSLNTRLQTARSEGERLAQLQAERETREAQLRSDRERLASLRVVEGRLARWDEERILLPELLRDLSLRLPDGVVLETLRRTGAEITITGRAGSAAAVREAADALSQLDRVRNLQLLWVEEAAGQPGASEQRFSLAGGLRYATREPAPFERVEPSAGDGGQGS